MKSYNPLSSISDQQWIQLVELLTENVLALNSRILSKVEILYSDSGHYPAAYFRLTTIMMRSKATEHKKEISGFVFGFNNNWDDDVYIHPLCSQGFREDLLRKNGINSFFTYHEVGVRKLLKFLDKVLKIWEDGLNNPQLTFNEWRELPLSQQS